MRAAMLDNPYGPPTVGEFPEPDPPADGEVLVHVETAGLGGWDVQGQMAYQLDVVFPCVVRGEGVGRTDDGRRVYFGERSRIPFGAFAERTVVPATEAWEMPEGVSDELAITMAIAGTGALIPLEAAKIQSGESVLVTGATGALGQLAVQLAKYLGAGRVVGAARGAEGLARLQERGIVDATVQLGSADDVAALRDAANSDGFDVVLDVVFGEPFVAALQASANGARIISCGAQAGLVAPLNLGHLLNRWHTCVGTGQLPPAQRREIWERLLRISQSEGIDVDYRRYTLEESVDAWNAQITSPHAKVIATLA